MTSDGAPRRLRRRVHPVAWVGPVAGSLVTVAVWAAVAHSSGSGWVQAIGALLAAVLAIGLIAPIGPAMRSQATCTTSPSDSVAGQSASLTFTANGPIRIKPLVPTGPIAWAGGDHHGARDVTIDVVPSRRGVIETVTVELASSMPFGIVWWAKQVVIPLTRPLHVAPRSMPPNPNVVVASDQFGDVGRPMPSHAGETKGVRPYLPGDLRRSIHWPATAHSGALMVTEIEHRSDEPVVIEVVLPADPDEAERVAEQVMTQAMGHLTRGLPVLLITLELGGRTKRVVADRIDLGRRLARAVAP